MKIVFAQFMEFHFHSISLMKPKRYGSLFVLNKKVKFLLSIIVLGIIKDEKPQIPQ